MDSKIILWLYIALSTTLLQGLVILLNFRIAFLLRQLDVKYPEQWYEKVWLSVSVMAFALLPVVVMYLLVRQQN